MWEVTSQLGTEDTQNKTQKTWDQQNVHVSAAITLDNIKKWHQSQWQ